MPELDVPEARIYAPGLGLMMFSPQVLTHTGQGANFMSELDYEPKGRRL
jgi:hypothetical protein